MGAKKKKKKWSRNLEQEDGMEPELIAYNAH